MRRQPGASGCLHRTARVEAPFPGLPGIWLKFQRTKPEGAESSEWTGETITLDGSALGSLAEVRLALR